MTDFPPELLDELCSADIDGELEAACADHGVAVEDARAAIAAHGSRRDALAAAGASVAAITAHDTIDELERRRLGRAAAARATPARAARRRSGAFAAVGGLAAAVLVAVVAIALASRGGGGDSLASRAEIATATTAPPTTIDVGAIRDGPDLARKLGVVHDTVTSGASGDAKESLDRRAPSTAPVAPQPESLNAYSQNSASTTVASGSPAGASTASGSTAGASRCLTTLPAASKATGLAIVAIADLHGIPVTVARGVLNGRGALWGFRASDCAILLFFDGA